jgi:hypothetical protein
MLGVFSMLPEGVGCTDNGALKYKKSNNICTSSVYILKFLSCLATNNWIELRQQEYVDHHTYFGFQISLRMGEAGGDCV